MSNLQTDYFKLDFQKVDQHTGGKWLIHGTYLIENKCIAAWRHETITWTNRDLSSNVFTGIQMRAISQKVPINVLCNMCSKAAPF